MLAVVARLMLLVTLILTISAPRTAELHVKASSESTNWQTGTDNWSEFRSAIFGYALRHPPQTQTLQTGADQDVKLVVAEGIGFRVVVLPNKQLLSPRGFAQERLLMLQGIEARGGPLAPRVISARDVQIGENLGYDMLVSNGYQTTRQVYFTRGVLAYEVRFPLLGDSAADQETRHILVQMLSTFRLIGEPATSVPVGITDGITSWNQEPEKDNVVLTKPDEVLTSPLEVPVFAQTYNGSFAHFGSRLTQ